MREGEGASRVNVADGERGLSLVGGAALVGVGLARRSPFGVGLMALGGYLLYRGAAGHCPLYARLGVDGAATDQSGLALLLDRPLSADRAVTIARPPDDLYRAWRDLEGLPRLMRHLESVVILSATRSRWTATAPFGRSVSWEAEIVDERSNELIAWRSLPGGEVTTTGSVRFRPAPGDRGTEVQVQVEYRLPGGPLGGQIARLLGDGPDLLVADDLRRFKQLMEAGEVASTRGQPAGGGRGGRREEPTLAAEPAADRSRPAADAVEAASIDSFPASDPPGWISAASGSLAEEGR